MEDGMGWAQARLDEIVRGEGRAPPVVDTLRLGLLDAWGEGWVRKRWGPSPDVLGADGCFFGGHIAALADQLLAFAAMTVAPDDQAFRTINLQVQFFRVTPAQPLDIEGRVLARTQQLISVEADFRRVDGELIARAAAQQVLTPLPGR
jgi:acyl-coenzyme A thioesterase PaaI-like protein